MYLFQLLPPSFTTVPPAGCSDPGVPDNGLRVGDDFSVGAAVFYRCFDDYDLVGAKFRVCQMTVNGVTACQLVYASMVSNVARILFLFRYWH